MRKIFLFISNIFLNVFKSYSTIIMEANSKNILIPKKSILF